MSKIIAFYVSARKKGCSHQLIDQVVAGAKSEGAEVITYDLNDGINGCQGCMSCRTHEGCAQKDNLASFFREYPDADGFVVGFPIYFGNLSGQGKIWLDRMYPLLAADISPRYPGKKCVTVYAQGSPDPDAYKAAIDANNGFIKMFGVDLIDSIQSCGSTDPGYQMPQELLDRAFEAGKRMVG
ncbi:MAG: flavodoxin family protein [Anaerovoracaceae bacterium]